MSEQNFTLNMTLRGTNEELTAMLNVFLSYYEKKNNMALSGGEVMRGGACAVIARYSGDRGYAPDKITEWAAGHDGDVNISSVSFYGAYNLVESHDVFREMAEAAPQAEFSAVVSGVSTYTEQRLDCDLKNGELRICGDLTDNNELFTSYVDYFMEQLPHERFVELFKLDPEEFDEDVYSDFIGDTLTFGGVTILEMSYDEMMDALDADSDLDEDGYEEVLAQIEEMDIDDYECYREDFGVVTVLCYNPITKEYIRTESDDEE